MNTVRNHRPRLLQGVLLSVLLLCSMTASADGPLPPFSSLYAIKGFGFQIGEFRSSLSKSADDDYVYETTTRTAGIIARFYKDVIEERSQWTWRDAAIRPQLYTYQRSGGKKEKQAKLVFHWDRKTVENTVDGQTWKMEIHDGVLDRMVVTLAMMLDLQQGKRDMTYTFADGGKLKTYRFRVIGAEPQQTPAGAFDTVKIERVIDDNKRSTTLWCAAKLHYLPVRIDQREEGDNYSMVLTGYTSP